MRKYVLIVETMFCDYEFDETVRERYFEAFSIGLKHLDRLTIPSSTDVFFIIYISSDKVSEIERVRSFINSLSYPSSSRFKLVTYSHPAEGYGYSKSDHPDLFKNPNRTAPRRDELFARALEGIAVGQYERLIRMSIDDDDFFLPWQLVEIVRAADLTYEEDKIIGTGLTNLTVAYPNMKKADVVRFSAHVHGNKFYVSSTELLERQRKISPWSLPEHFNPANVARMARAGVHLKSIRDNIPGYVYVRQESNLSRNDKSIYYEQTFKTLENENSTDVVDLLPFELPSLGDEFRSSIPALVDFPVEASGSTSAIDEYKMMLPQYLITNDSEYYAVLLDRSGVLVDSIKMQPGKVYSSRVFGEKLNESSCFIFIQERNASLRVPVTPRDRLARVELLNRIQVDTLLLPAKAVPEKELSSLRNSFLMADWLSSRALSFALQGIVKGFQHECSKRTSLPEETALEHIHASLDLPPSSRVGSLINYLAVLVCSRRRAELD